MGMSSVLRITSSEVYSLLHRGCLSNSIDIIEELLCTKHYSHWGFSNATSLLPQCLGDGEVLGGKHQALWSPEQAQGGLPGWSLWQFHGALCVEGPSAWGFMFFCHHFEILNYYGQETCVCLLHPDSLTSPEKGN